MANKIAQDIGENAEYIKEIITNNIELKKIELLEKSSHILSTLIILLCMITISFFITLLTIALAIIFLAKYYMTYPAAILVVIGVFILLGTIIYLVKDQIITRPITNYINSIILK